MFSLKKIILRCSNCSECLRRNISVSQIDSGRFDKFKKLIDVNWLKKEEKWPKKLIEKPLQCADDPCIPGAPEPRLPQDEEEQCPPQPAAIVKKICEPCPPCPDPEKDHPVLKPEVEIPLPNFLCASYLEPKPCKTCPRYIPREEPCPLGPAIDTPRREILKSRGFCPEPVKRKSLWEVFTPPEIVEEMKKKEDAKIRWTEVNLDDVTHFPENYKKKRIAVICKVPKNVMQSGTHNTKVWLVKFDRMESWENPTIGWVSSGDCHSSLEVEFATAEAAIAHCKKHGLNWMLLDKPKEKVKVKIKNYIDNFSWAKRIRVSTK